MGWGDGPRGEEAGEQAEDHVKPGARQEEGAHSPTNTSAVLRGTGAVLLLVDLLVSKVKQLSFTTQNSLSSMLRT